MRLFSLAILLPIALFVAAAAPPAAAIEPDTDFGSHAPRDPAARSEAGIERMEISRRAGVITSRLLGADGAALGTLRIQWPGDGTTQLELTRDQEVWAGEWHPAARSLAVSRLGAAPSGTLVWRPVGDGGGGRWDASAVEDPPARRAGLLLAYGYAETVDAMGLWAWQ